MYVERKVCKTYWVLPISASFQRSLEHNYEYIFEMDADFSHNPADLPRLYKACAEEGADVSIGSRYVSGVNVVNWPMGRY